MYPSYIPTSLLGSVTKIVIKKGIVSTVSYHFSMESRYKPDFPVKEKRKTLNSLQSTSSVENIEEELRLETDPIIIEISEVLFVTFAIKRRPVFDGVFKYAQWRV